MGAMTTEEKTIKGKRRTRDYGDHLHSTKMRGSLSDMQPASDSDVRLNDTEVGSAILPQAFHFIIIQHNCSFDSKNLSQYRAK